jgi:DNA-damage-inducible protein J
MSVQVATRINEDENRLFRDITMKLGTTPADALRIFIAAFNTVKGFPFDVRINAREDYEAFESEKEATAFATDLSLRTINAAQ